MPSLASLASSLGQVGINEKTSPVAIQELKENDEAIPDGLLRFQYFPESISDSKEVNWAPKEIPGGSLPLYQWISSGGRTISFVAVFTADVDFSEEGNADSKSASDVHDLLKTSGELSRNQDIRTAIMWLRRFMMPRYGSETGTGAPLTTAPRKLQLHMPGTGIGWAGGHKNTAHSGQHFITAIMTGCEVEWVQYFPSGFPRIATASLSFAQIAQFKGQVEFPAPDLDFDKKVYGTSGGTETFQYTLNVTKSWK